MIQAAIFDMDGLLIDSEPFWRAAHIAEVAKHGHTITQDDARQMAGLRTRDIAAHWKQRFNIALDTSQFESQITGEAVRQIKSDGRALPGVEQALQMMRQHQVKVAVASSSSPELIAIVLEKLQLKQYVDVTHSAKGEKFGKPHPDVFLTTARLLGVEPEHCLVFEDAITGVRAAKAAGMKCVAVPEAANLALPEFAQAADLVIPSLLDIDWETISKLL